MQTQYLLTPTLPWDRKAEEEKIFRRSVVLFILIFFIIALIIPNIQLPEKQREEVERVPPRLAKLVMERQKPPPKVEEKPREEPKKEEPKKEEPKPKEEVKKEEPKPKKEEAKPQPTKQEAAKKRAAAAVAVFDDALADLRQIDTSSLKTEQQAVSSDALTAGAVTERALIGRAAVGSSGGVAVAKASSGGGGSGKLGTAPGSGMQASQVKSAIADPAAQQAARKGAGGKARRTTEDVQLVFDRNKGAIYSIYRRALRENPALEGTLVLRLEIQPNGQVTRCEVVSSQLKDADLERKIVAKVRSLNFGRMDVDVWRETYPIAFIPS